MKWLVEICCILLLVLLPWCFLLPVLPFRLSGRFTCSPVLPFSDISNAMECESGESPEAGRPKRAAAKHNQFVGAAQKSKFMYFLVAGMTRVEHSAGSTTYL